MSPVDLVRLRAEMAAKQRVSDEQARANLKQTGMEALSAMPIVGNAMSAYDAYGAGRDALAAAGEGRMGAAAGNAGLFGLSALGAVTGLPFGRGASAAAKDAGRTVGMGVGRDTGDLLTGQELLDLYRARDLDHMRQMAQEMPADVKEWRRLSAATDKADEADILAHYGPDYEGPVADYPQSEKTQALTAALEALSAKYGGDMDIDTLDMLRHSIKKDIRRAEIQGMGKP
jgi:hypothetical protein